MSNSTHATARHASNGYEAVASMFMERREQPGIGVATILRWAHALATDMAAAPPTVALSAMRSSFQHAREIPDLIEELKVPVATINPDDAPTDLVSMGNHGVDVVIMTGVGHFLMMEDPDRFNDVLFSTLDDLL